MRLVLPVIRPDWDNSICLERLGQIPLTERLPTTMPTCDNCEAHVSERFARVFALDSGRVEACPNCSTNAGIAEQARRRGANN